MNQTALCPSCKKEVVFDTTGGAASVCPACGARFELAAEPKRARRVRAVHGLIFLGWMFAPSLLALALVAMLADGQHPGFDPFFAQHAALFWGMAGLSLISCYAACSWLTGRFTEKVWPRVLVGLFLGACVFLCNVVIVFFGACVVARGM